MFSGVKDNNKKTSSVIDNRSDTFGDSEMRTEHNTKDIDSLDDDYNNLSQESTSATLNAK